MNVCKQTSYISHGKTLKRCFNLKFSTYYFPIKTKILTNTQICISVPLKVVTKELVSIIEIITKGMTATKILLINLMTTIYLLITKNDSSSNFHRSIHALFM